MLLENCIEKVTGLVCIGLSPARAQDLMNDFASFQSWDSVLKENQVGSRARVVLVGYLDIVRTEWSGY